MEDNCLKIENGLKTAFIDSKYISDDEYKAKFLFNDSKNFIKVNSDIQDELRTCDEFIFCVAFIKRSNLIEQLLMDLKDLNIKGKILTTDYENSTDPSVLRSIHNNKNIEIRMYRTKDAKQGFHPKGYIFKHGNEYHIIIGSSNLTNAGTTTNVEWNTKLITTANGEFINKLFDEFNFYWNNKYTKSYDDFIDQYSFEIKKINCIKKLSNDLLKKSGIFNDSFKYDENITNDIINNLQKVSEKSKDTLFDKLLTQISKYDKKYAANVDFGKIIDFIDKFSRVDTKATIIEKQKEIISENKVISYEKSKLEPNDMQTDFTKNLLGMMAEGKNKALLISATGTGKTYASAFAIREINPKRMLFVVHNEKIDRQAMDAYKDVFGKTKTFGILSGNSDERNADFVFATMQTIRKPEVLETFKKDCFDVIIIDEAHHVLASSYLTILDYFKPKKLLLGMTATPERTDGDIYSVFDHNIAYEIRLQKALEQNMLCPFHYFGITDFKIDGVELDDSSSIDFNSIDYKKRVDHILKESEYYGYSGSRLKGLIFVSRVEEGKKISELINKHKYEDRLYRSEFLSGDINNKPEQIDDIIDKLINDEREDYIDFIITVNKFNEGVDIKEVNQIIMLRPTESVIVFTQQLGRGLRLDNNKEFTVVLDFIANYDNNFMIPMALNGDRTYNKDTVRKYVAEGGKLIAGDTSIQFDEIAKTKIYSAIDNKNFSDIKIIKDSYFNLKYKLGRIPKIIEFDIYNEIDPIRIFENRNLISYHNFLKKYDNKDYSIKFNNIKEKYLEYISSKFANGKRIHELLLLQIIMQNKKSNVFATLKKQLNEQYNIHINDNTIDNLLNIMTNNFATGTGRDTYSNVVFIDIKDGNYLPCEKFIKMLDDNDFKTEIEDLIEFGIFRYQKNYSNRYKNTNLVLYEKYTYEDVCRLLDWEKSEVALNIGGYKYNEKTKTFPIFINYVKSDLINDTIKYEDRFIDKSTIIAISKNKRNIDSDDIMQIKDSVSLGISLHLFIRKNKDDSNSKEFYYLGNVLCNGELKEVIKENQKVVEIPYKLDKPVRDDIYDYITRE